MYLEQQGREGEKRIKIVDDGASTAGVWATRAGGVILDLLGKSFGAAGQTLEQLKVTGTIKSDAGTIKSDANLNLGNN
jgi:hypothetical protein